MMEVLLIGCWIFYKNLNDNNLTFSEKVPSKGKGFFLLFIWLVYSYINSYGLMFL